MAKKRFLERLFGFMGVDEEETVVEGDDDAEAFDEESEDTPPLRGKRQKGRVVNLHVQKQVKLIVAEPSTFDDVQGIADHVKSHRPVIVNMEGLDRELAKRMVDFLSGVTYALNGAMQKVGEGIFLLAPDNFDVAGDIQSSIRGPEEFAWRR